MVLHGIALYCMALHCIAWYCMELHGIAPSCPILRHLAPSCAILHHLAPSCTILHQVAPCCTMLHHVAPCCTILPHCTFTIPLSQLYRPPPGHDPSLYIDEQKCPLEMKYRKYIHWNESSLLFGGERGKYISSSFRRCWMVFDKFHLNKNTV